MALDPDNIDALVGTARVDAILGGYFQSQDDRAAHLAAAIYRFRAAAESDNSIYLAQRERIIDGMRKAGVPEE